MKIFDLLEEIKIGDEDFKKLKLSEDIESDVEELEEGSRYVRINRRLDKMLNRISSKAGTKSELKSVLSKLSKSSKVFESVDNMLWRGEKPTKAQARAKMVSLKKNYESITNELRDRTLKEAIKESGIATLMGSALGSMLYGAKKLQDIAKTTSITSLQKRFVPPYLKYDSNLELNFLNKAENGGYEPSIREDILNDAGEEACIDLVGEVDRKIVTKAVAQAKRKFDINTEDGMKKAIAFIKKYVDENCRANTQS